MMGILNRNEDKSRSSEDKPRNEDKPRLTTADLAAAAREQRDVQHDAQRESPPDRPEARVEPRTDRPLMREEPRVEPPGMHGGGVAPHRTDEELAPLFAHDAAAEFRTRWDAVQIGFVDDPAKAVREADELVAAVLKSLADSFAAERNRFESEKAQAGEAATENHRVALRRYRAFFQRLLSL
jgi:hypothetical protein